MTLASRPNIPVQWIPRERTAPGKGTRRHTLVGVKMFTFLKTSLWEADSRQDTQVPQNMTKAESQQVCISRYLLLCSVASFVEKVLMSLSFLSGIVCPQQVHRYVHFTHLITLSVDARSGREFGVDCCRSRPLFFQPPPLPTHIWLSTAYPDIPGLVSIVASIFSS